MTMWHTTARRISYNDLWNDGNGERNVRVSVGGMRDNRHLQPLPPSLPLPLTLTTLTFLPAAFFPLSVDTSVS